jgi:hypothetical protein
MGNISLEKAVGVSRKMASARTDISGDVYIALDSDVSGDVFGSPVYFLVEGGIQAYLPQNPKSGFRIFETASTFIEGFTASSQTRDLGIHKPAWNPFEGYERYNQRNWDGYDAEPITSETVSFAKIILEMLPKTFGEPDIAPGADGTIGLEWIPEAGPLEKLFLDVGPGKTWRAYWTKRDGTFDRIMPQPFRLGTQERINKLFADLRGRFERG